MANAAKRMKEKKTRQHLAKQIIVEPIVEEVVEIVETIEEPIIIESTEEPIVIEGGTVTDIEVIEEVKPTRKRKTKKVK